MSFDHESCASISGEESFYLSSSAALASASALTLSVMINLIFTMSSTTTYSNIMSFDHDSCAFISGEDAFNLSLSTVLTLVSALTLSVLINMIFIVRSFSSTSLAAHPMSNNTNHTNRAERIVAKVGVDEVAIILSYLPRPEIMRARVCTTWRDAAKKTIVPLYVTKGEIYLPRSVMSYYAMTVMTTALPCLQQLTIGHLGNRRTFSIGEDPDEERATHTANDTMYDINLISNFSKLRSLRLNSPDLNGRYPVLFNFPHLQNLTITKYCQYLKWDLEMLSGFPLLKELHCNIDLNENISSLRVLKNTLQKVIFSDCSHIHGNLMDLADFPRLNKLNLKSTSVTGDIRHIREGDFPSLATFLFPSTVIGGMGYEFRRIGDVPGFMHAIHPFLQRTLRQPRPPFDFVIWEHQLKMAYNWELSEDSPDWYMPEDEEETGNPLPPFWLKFIRAGPRLGWCWYSHDNDHHCCQICWLGSAPSSDSVDYEVYIREFNSIHNCADYHTYADHHQPPTEEEYQRLFVDN